jgi:predicted RNA-binding Zn-ribbon protein involved in translation (DUF1610 family)
MSPHTRSDLKLVTPPFAGRVLEVPPVLNASDHTVDFLCGACGALLMQAEHGQVHNVTIHCLACGSFNTTNE